MQTKYKVFIEIHVIQNFSELMSRVKITEASMADMGSKEVTQDKFKRWNSKPLFPKRKREVDIVETSNKNREPPLPLIPLEKAKLGALVRAWIEDGELKLRPMKRQPTLEEKKKNPDSVYSIEIQATPLLIAI